MASSSVSAASRRRGDSADAPRQAPRRFGFGRLALFRGVERGARALGGRSFYRRVFLAPGRFRVRRERVAVAGLPSGLAGFRIAQFSDLHAGPFLGAGTSPRSWRRRTRRRRTWSW